MRHELPELERLLARLQRGPDHLRLPASLSGRPRGKGRALHGLAVLADGMGALQLLFWLLMLVLLAHGAGLAWGWILAALLAAAWLMHRRRERRAAGWEIDFAARTLRPAGVAGAPQVLEPAQDWSVGTVGGMQSERGGYAVLLELRHARRGPVAELVRLHFWQGGEALSLDIDELADGLARQLGIRRSGSRLGPAERSRLAG